MSDYISKSALIEDVHKIRCQNGISEEVGYNRPLTDIANVFEYINNQPTLDETEIIRKAFEKVIEQLNGLMPIKFNGFGKTLITIEDVIKILKEECGINE